MPGKRGRESLRSAQRRLGLVAGRPHAGVAVVRLERQLDEREATALAEELPGFLGRDTRVVRELADRPVDRLDRFPLRVQHGALPRRTPGKILLRRAERSQTVSGIQ